LAVTLKVEIKDENLVRIETLTRLHTRGALCRIGRFEQLNESRARITSPMVRNAKGVLENWLNGCSLGGGGEEICGVREQLRWFDISRIPTETITQFQKLITGTQKSKIVDTLDGKEYRLIYRVSASTQTAELLLR